MNFDNDSPLWSNGNATVINSWSRSTDSTCERAAKTAETFDTNKFKDVPFGGYFTLFFIMSLSEKDIKKEGNMEKGRQKGREGEKESETERVKKRKKRAEEREGRGSTTLRNSKIRGCEVERN